MISDLERRVLWYVREFRSGDRGLAALWLRDEAFDLRVRVARALHALGIA